MSLWSASCAAHPSLPRKTVINHCGQGLRGQGVLTGGGDDDDDDDDYGTQVAGVKVKARTVNFELRPEMHSRS